MAVSSTGKRKSPVYLNMKTLRLFTGPHQPGVILSHCVIENIRKCWNLVSEVPTLANEITIK